MVQQADKKGILFCRMVRDNLDKPVVQSEKQNQAPESQNRQPEEPAGPEQNKSPERDKPESPELQLERKLDLLHWNKFNLEEEPDTWRQPLSGADAVNFPTHLRPFSSAAEYRLVKHTFMQLQHSGYYWGSMTMEEAHSILTKAPLGTFLIRDSGQSDVFFTLSYQSDDGPTSVRVQLNNLHFSLYGSHRTFPSLFALLTYYTGSSCKLTVPYRSQRPERLKQMCRRALARTFAAEKISTLPGVSSQDKDYVLAYPYCI
ncbi:suppressor of cytokine signaling 1b [Notolabrus celidotus]|uniref:suppressor of cytokine signaling 1b n=1 Tax=Notolabrus celidotus TaxID=1203425 RepID=UPI00148F7D38|nr:suppressor of cytokine signaling 1b [Notolabrus celidotus]XP_034542847.1 suppressor of cytokine signaling 1b [Notolabrus celidotus]